MKKYKLIISIRAGSHLYGTNIESSDEDIVNIFLPTEKTLLGLEKIKESGPEKENKDLHLFALKKFALLALDNNPNVLELLFVNKENILFINDIGKELLNLRYNFLSKNIKHRFLGYAFSQKHKMVIKLENYEALMEAYSYLKSSPEIKFLNDVRNHPLFKRKDKNMSIGDINFPATITRKKAMLGLEMRISKFGKRQELMSKYGFDVKFGMNLLRLMYEGIRLLRDGDLTFPLEDRETLLKIRKGEISMNDVIKLSEMLEANVEELYNTTKLPHSPDFESVNNFVIKAHKKVVKGEI